MSRSSAEPAARRARSSTAGGGGGSLAATVNAGPTTSRGRRTRSALVAAAREAFEELGFRDARISDIAQRAGTSYGVFYHYFDSKESILLELFTVVTGEMYNASQTQDT